MKNYSKQLKTVLAFVMSMVLMFVCIPYDYSYIHAIDTSEEAEQALEDKISSLQSEQADLKSKLEAAETNQAEQERQKEYLDSLVLSTQNEIDATKLLIEEYKGKIELKQKEIKTLSKEIEEKSEIMMERLRFTYENGNASYLEMIFEAKSFSDFLMTVERVGSMLDYDRTLMEGLQEDMKALEEEEHTLVTTQEDLVATEESLVEKEADLKVQISDTEAYIAELESDQKALKAEYEKAKKAEEAANSEIETLLAERAREQEERRKAEAAAAAAANKNNGGGNTVEYAPVFGGDFIWPVPGYSTISSPYGWRVLWGRNDFHLGIDIPAPSGTNIYAAAAGEVLIATWHYSYGYYILVDHGDGFATLYAHNSQLLVSAGQRVEQGQHIAEMGTTGSSTGNHLHFEVRVNGSTVNPLGYVSAP